MHDCEPYTRDRNILKLKISMNKVVYVYNVNTTNWRLRERVCAFVWRSRECVQRRETNVYALDARSL